ncbi:MAG: TetR/AcrR family transcriptional regulator [Chitinophagaceae bacterium]
MKKAKRDTGTETLILQKAREVFLTKGMDGARMQDIADAAGINKALLHYYFKSKEALFERIFNETAGRFISSIKEILASDLHFATKIERICESYISMAIENPYIPLFVVNEMNKRPTQFLEKLYRGGMPEMHKFAAQLDAEVAAGNIRSVSPAQLIISIMSMCVFPFIGKPVFASIMGLDDLQYHYMMEQRKTFIPQFILQALKP